MEMKSDEIPTRPRPRSASTRAPGFLHYCPLSIAPSRADKTNHSDRRPHVADHGLAPVVVFLLSISSIEIGVLLAPFTVRSSSPNRMS